MKYTKHLLLLLLILLLTGCKTTPDLEKLDSPSNLDFQELLIWDEVENATGYDVYLNDIAFHSDQNYYVISEEGVYDIYVVAKANGYENSDPSITLESLRLEYENIINPVISISGNAVTWTDIDDAISYNVVINGVLTNTAITGIVLVPTGIFSVSIQAVYPIGTSNISAPVFLALDLETEATMQFQYSRNSIDDLLLCDVMFLGDVYLEDDSGNIIESTGTLTYSNDYRAISSAFISTQTTDTIEFNLLVGTKRIPVEITISDKDTPYIMSSSIIIADGTKDIQLQFELFDGEVYSINGTSEDTVLYSVAGSVLTIEKEFIAEKFIESDAFTLSYVLNVGDDSVIGYLHFDKTIIN